MTTIELHLSILIGALILERLWVEKKGIPHIVCGIGNVISWLNKILYAKKKINGLILVLIIVPGFFTAAYFANLWLSAYPIALLLIGIFITAQLLAGSLLIRIGIKVFTFLENGDLPAARKQLTWLVGRDTQELTDQEIRQAALESMSENLSDGMIAPMFYFALGGIPGILAYKVINTLDSRFGYKNEQYHKFGYFSAKLDDVANYLPARITAILIALSSPRHASRSLSFIRKYGRAHLSPNAGYPESALAGVLNCRFGGPHDYSGELIDKDWIGENARPLNQNDIIKTAQINQRATFVFLLLIITLGLITDQLISH